VTTPDDAPAARGRAAAPSDCGPPSPHAASGARARGATAARPAAERPATGTRTAGEPTAGDPAAEGPATERPAGEGPAAQDPAGEGPDSTALRAMRWWDLDAVLALEHELFPEDAWSRALFWSELADAGHPGASRTYLVAQDLRDGRITGYAGLAAVAGTGDVQTIAVARDRWGTGLGARLLTALLRAATAAECHEVLLEVRVDNDRAQRLYRRFGFEPIGFRKGYYQPGNVDALVMRLADLTGPDPGQDTAGPDADARGPGAGTRGPDTDTPDRAAYARRCGTDAPAAGPAPDPAPGPAAPAPGGSARPPARPRPNPSEETHG
jgi:[ribosomal protein S18]-alanine N-acetyltransferase